MNSPTPLTASAPLSAMSASPARQLSPRAAFFLLASITVSLMDEEAKRLWDAPVHTAALRWGV